MDVKSRLIYQERKITMYQYAALVTNVVDGDTVDLLIDLGFKVQIKQRIRLSRIDTPERTQDKFAEAKQFVHDMIFDTPVILETRKVSKFGYYLGEIYTTDGKNVSDALLAAKLAKPYDGGAK